MTTNIPRRARLVASRVADVDTIDPPNTMASDFSFKFSTGTAPPADAAPTVSSVSPANGQTNIAPSSNVTAGFSEPVTLTSGWFTIACTVSGSHTAAASGGPSSYTLNPDKDFAYGESCTVTIVASRVADVDTIDPPNTMASDFSFKFSTGTAPATDAPPKVISIYPSNGLTNIAPSSNVAIVFSEAVTLTSGWFTIACTVSGSHTATVSGGPSSYTLNPDKDFAYGESCTVTIVASRVADVDTIDPPNTMASDVSFKFSTASH